jgi:ubiquitin C-terminal hydrolase
MQFKSLAQQKLCWLKYNRDVKKGVKPKWNCPKFQQETPMFKSLPIHKGVRGGIFKICPINGKKIYKVR